MVASLPVTMQARLRLVRTAASDTAAGANRGRRPESKRRKPGDRPPVAEDATLPVPVAPTAPAPVPPQPAAQPVYVQYVEVAGSTGSRLKSYLAMGAAMSFAMMGVSLIFRAIGMEGERDPADARRDALVDALLHAAAEGGAPTAQLR